MLKRCVRTTHNGYFPPEVILDLSSLDGVRCLVGEDMVEFYSNVRSEEPMYTTHGIRLIPMATLEQISQHSPRGYLIHDDRYISLGIKGRVK